MEFVNTAKPKESFKMARAHTIYDRLFRYAEFLGYGEVHMKIDLASELRAIIGIHSLKLGPALGGCRCIPYHTTDEALKDALRLGQMMSYKAAISNLPHGGAKAVLLRPYQIKNRDAYFEAFGDFVEELGGRYIVGVDSGTGPADMEIIARRTKYVSCLPSAYADGGDPSPHTALGVQRGIQAAVKFKLGRYSMEGVHVAIQGAGHVGYSLAQGLKSLGARLTMSDINETALRRCVDELGVAFCSPEEILTIPADVLAPCALGGVLNRDSINALRVPIVAGSANNQLAHRHHGVLLHERGILYAPDFVINSGGLIHATVIYDHADQDKAEKQIYNIYDTLMEIFAQSARENRAASEIAEQIAVSKLSA